MNDLSEPIHDVLLDFLQQAGRMVRPRLTEMFEDVVDLLTPHPPMSLRTTEGEILTGVVIVDRGQVIAFLGTRSAAPPPAPHRGPRPFERDEDYWGSPHDPYGR